MEAPPRGTPFGERWHDLLHAEWLALQVLAEHGFATASTQVIETAARTHLESIRLDRIGAHGRLIGNTDMHFGNLSLWADEPARERFSLAPLYDMLPMRWRPDAFTGLQDYTAFEPQRPPRGAVSIALAQQFWRRLAEHGPVSEPLRSVAAAMALKTGLS